MWLRIVRFSFNLMNSHGRQFCRMMFLTLNYYLLQSSGGVFSEIKQRGQIAGMFSFKITIVRSQSRNSFWKR